MSFAQGSLLPSLSAQFKPLSILWSTILCIRVHRQDSLPRTNHHQSAKSDAFVQDTFQRIHFLIFNTLHIPEVGSRFLFYSNALRLSKNMKPWNRQSPFSPNSKPFSASSLHKISKTSSTAGTLNHVFPPPPLSPGHQLEALS